MTFKQTVDRTLYFLSQKQKFLISLFALIALIISVQQYVLGPKNFWNGTYTHYNNFVIFKNSFHHLVQQINLYAFYPAEYGDLYKYSPTFALVMGIFYALPDLIGLMVWNLLNVLVFIIAVSGIRFQNKRTSVYIVVFVLFELILTTQNAQSNALLAGLLIMAFNDFEKRKNFRATCWIVLSGFIKVYSGAGALLLFLYPDKIKTIGYLAFNTLILFFLPLLVVPFSSLLLQYEQWFSLIQSDSTISNGMSFFAYANLFAQNTYIKAVILGSGILFLTFPFFKKKSKFTQRLNLLSLLLIWIVVFNPKAESPTFVIAMTGIGIWFFNGEKQPWKTILCLAALFFTSLYFTDIVPRVLKKEMISGEYIKGFFPCIIFLVLTFLSFKKERSVSFPVYNSQDQDDDVYQK